MDSIKMLNQALAYLENNLAGEIDFGKLARLAGCPENQFRRSFAYLAGVTLSEHVRRRRMSLAAESLLRNNPPPKISDLAALYGYESPEAFSRAFNAVHGVNPSQAAQSQIKHYPPLHFTLSITGEKPMDYRITDLPAFRIIGYAKEVPLQFEGENQQIAELAGRLTPDSIALLKSLSNVGPLGIISASANFRERLEEGSILDQYLGVAGTSPCPQGFDCLEVPASTWAVFSSRGPFPQTVQQTWARIYAEWLPSSAFTPTGGPEILRHLSQDLIDPNLQSEIWLPVQAK